MSRLIEIGGDALAFFLHMVIRRRVSASISKIKRTVMQL
jgi:hypothetical protein